MRTVDVSIVITLNTVRWLEHAITMTWAMETIKQQDRIIINSEPHGTWQQVHIQISLAKVTLAVSHCKMLICVFNQKLHIDIADLACVTDFKISKITYYQVF